MNAVLMVFDPADTDKVKESRRVGDMSEAWASRSLWCPSCRTGLDRAAVGKPSLDLLCASCGLEFELKSRKVAKRQTEIKTIPGGSYAATIKRFGVEGGGPNLIHLTYIANYEVVGATLFPSFYLVPSIVQARPPLQPPARRAGWTGCNIRIDMIPASGRLAWISSGALVAGEVLQAEWRSVIDLQTATRAGSRGWLIDVLRVVEGLPPEFTLADVYNFEVELAALHPDNTHVRAKIRQQLQFLRDKGRIEFRGRGRYSRADESGTNLGRGHRSFVDGDIVQARVQQEASPGLVP